MAGRSQPSAARASRPAAVIRTRTTSMVPRSLAAPLLRKLPANVTRWNRCNTLGKFVAFGERRSHVVAGSIATEDEKRIPVTGWAASDTASCPRLIPGVATPGPVIKARPQLRIAASGHVSYRITPASYIGHAMIRVAFLGGAEVGLGFLHELHAAHQRGLCELIGARPTHKSEASHPMVAPFLPPHNVPILEAVPDCDLIFSAGNHHIFKAAEIAKAKRGIINFHAAPLPEYAGSAAPAFAILNEESQFGVTFHYIIPEIDAGDILHVERFPIDAHWTAKEL